MRVLFTSLRTPSHFFPLVPFVAACQRRGHEVAVAAPAELAEHVAKTGAAFFPFGHPGDEGLRPLWARFRPADEEASQRLVIGEIFAGACARAALPDLLRTMDAWRPAIVVRESQEYSAVIGAYRTGIPHVQVAISARSFERPMVPYAAPSLGALGQSAGLPADPSGQRLLDEPALTLHPASLELPGSPPSVTHRFRAPRKEAAPLPDWWPGRRGPFVYATLGTVAGNMEAQRSKYRVVLEAVDGLPARVLLTTGHDLPAEALGQIPSNVRVERFVPQEQLLPHAAAVLCHGGSGTVVGTLAAGVPMVVAPLFADQPFNATRVAAAGAGLAMPPGEPRSSDLRAALSRVLEDGSFRVAARRLAAEIAALPSIEEAGETIEKLAS
jgi:UDP:flavonoid glycosyltransferase YjiC (YdhE family)